METSTHTKQSQPTTPTDGPALVDPRAPRFGQSLTALTLGVAIALQLPVLVYALGVILSAAVISGWRIDAYALLWRHGALRLLDPPTAREPASPHRFARVVGAVVTAGASVTLLAGFPVVGYVLAGLVAVLAGLAATTGFCLGCRMYRQVQFFQRLGLV
ncbi:MAG: DUF4395 domain-containing protein [Haloarculaceae archaeon]